MDAIDASGIRLVAAELRRLMDANRDRLRDLDQAIGDGDLGLTMTRGFAAAEQAVAADEPPGKLFVRMGLALAKAAPSTMGTLMATGFMRGGKAIGEAPAVDTAILSTFFRAFVDSIIERGKTRIGNKTVVDALAPAAAALDESAGRGDPLRLAVRSAARAAADGRETAKGLVAQHGKAAVFRDQTIGLEDPGAYVGALVLEAFANVCGSPDDPPRDAPRIVRCGETEVTVMPSCGAIVTRVTVGGVDLLYLDQATLASPTGAIRGGIPLLFPFAGELRNGVLTATGTAMPRHGFARRAAWHVTSATSDRISMHLPFDDEAHAQYPFDCHVHQVVTAISGGVQIDLSVENRDARPLPLAPGWHPYFPCPRDRKRECLAQIVPAEDLTAEPLACDVNVLAPSGGRLTFAVPGIGAVTLRFSAQLKTLEVWTLPDADFVCIEPWVGPSNVINTPDRIVVGVRERVVFSMGIELSRTAAPESD